MRKGIDQKGSIPLNTIYQDQNLPSVDQYR